MSTKTLLLALALQFIALCAYAAEQRIEGTVLQVLNKREVVVKVGDDKVHVYLRAPLKQDLLVGERVAVEGTESADYIRVEHREFSASTLESLDAVAGR